MYNTDFIVKYHDIEEELLNKIQNENENENELEYTSEDVKLICDKLYQDELLSVFNINNILDDKFDLIIKQVFNIMIKNSDFVSIINEGKEFFSAMNDFDNDQINNTLDKQLNIEMTDDNNMILFFTILFNQQIFYLTHKCICQMIKTNNIDNDLLVKLKEKSKIMFAK